MTTTLPPTTADPGPSALGKISRRLLPFLILLYVVNYVDRTNVAMAKLQLMRDVKLSEAAYGLGAGLFFVGYFLFEIPSNLLLHRLGARRWIARIMISWGLVSAAMLFVRGPASFYSLRLLLGAAEAGFFPGIILYLTYWVPARHRAATVATFMTSTTFSGILGNPLAGYLLRLDGRLNLFGWQWLFLLEGLLPVLLGVMVWLILPDRPTDAAWLTDREKSWLATELASEQSSDPHHISDLLTSFRSPRLWLLASLYFMSITGLYGLTFWAPTLIQSATPTSSNLQIGFLSSIPYLAGAIAMVLIARHSDHTHERRYHILATSLTAALGMALVSRATTATTVTLCLSLAAAGVFSTFGPFWALATRHLTGPAAPASIAAVNSLGNLAGFCAPYALGYAKTHTGSFSPGLLLVSSTLATGAALALLAPRNDPSS